MSLYDNLFHNELRLSSLLQKGDTVQAHLELMDYDGRNLWKGDIDFQPVWGDDGRMHLENKDQVELVSRKDAMRRLQDKVNELRHERRLDTGSWSMTSGAGFDPCQTSDWGTVTGFQLISATKEDQMACPICGAATKREEFIKAFDKRGDIKKTKQVQVFRCGTRKTAGELETEKPRIKIGKDCAQPAE